MSWVIPLLLLFLICESLYAVTEFKWENNRQHDYLVHATMPLKNTTPPLSQVLADSTQSAISERGEESGEHLSTQKKIITPSPTSLSKKIDSSPGEYSSEKIVVALNNYRNKKGVSSLRIDSKLISYAQKRAQYLNSIGKLDNHTQFNAYLKGNAFSDLGFNSLGENNSQGFVGSEVNLIEGLFAKDTPHENNQLNPQWIHIGVGVSGKYVDIIFGGKKR
jgi:uncharacterized protein YkwD